MARNPSSTSLTEGAESNSAERALASRRGVAIRWAAGNKAIACRRLSSVIGCKIALVECLRIPRFAHRLLDFYTG
jgi:hypothetical protein